MTCRSSPLLLFGKWWAWLILFVSLCLTTGISIAVKKGDEEKNLAEFNARVDDVKARIRLQLLAYEYMLHGAGGLFSTSLCVDGKEWRHYLDSLGHVENYPGLRGMGFVLRNAPGNDNCRVRQASRQAWPRHDVATTGRRAEYFSGLYFLDTFPGRNRRILGSDFFASQVQRAAMERARDSGAPVVPGAVLLDQEASLGSQSSFVMYVPVYRKGLPLTTIEERRAALLLEVIGSFSINDLIAGVLGKELADLDIELSDGRVPELPVYDSDPAYQQSPLFSSMTSVEINGHPWRLFVRSRPSYKTHNDALHSLFIFTAGAAFSLLLYAYIASLARTRERALALAGNMTAAYRSSAAKLKKLIAEQARLIAIIEATPDYVGISDRAGREIYVNTAGRKMAGIDGAADRSGRMVADCHPIWALSIVEKTGVPSAIRDGVWMGETALLTCDGREIPVSQVILSHKNDDGIVTHLSTIMRDISNIRQGEERYRNIFDGATDPIALADAETGELLDVNEAMVQLVGWSKPELIGKSQRVLHPPEAGNPVVSSDFEQHRCGKVSERIEARVVTRNGEIRDVEIKASRITLDGRPVMIGFFRDIAERKAAERALLAQQRFMRQVIDTDPNQIHVRDTQGTYLLVNQALADALGMAPDEIIGRNIAEISPYPEEVESSLQADRKVVQARQEVRTIERSLTGGQERWFISTKRPIELPDGTVNILGIAVDITEQRQAEYELNKMTELLVERVGALTENKERLAQAQAQAHLGNWSLDVLGGEVHWSAEVYRIFGLDQQTVLNREVFLACVHPDDRERVINTVDEAVGTCNAEYGMDYRIVLADGTRRFVHEQAKTVCDRDGFVVSVFGTVQDITEQKTYEESLFNANELMERIFANLHTHVAYLDRNFNFIRVNQAYANADGHPPEYYVGKNHFELYPNAENEAIFRRVVASGEPYAALAKPFVYEQNQERGVTYWDLVVQPVRDTEGKVSGLVLSLLNVTAQKVAEGKLRLWARALDASVNSIMIVDATQQSLPIIYANPAFSRITGYELDEVLGKNPKFLQGDDCEQPGLDDLRQAVRESRDGQAILRNYKKDGTMFWNELLVAPVPDETGRVTHFVGITSDITERKRAEEALSQFAVELETKVNDRTQKLQKINEILSTQEEEIHALVDHLVDCILTINAKGTVISANPVATRLFGYMDHEVIGSNISTFIPELTENGIKPYLERFLSTGGWRTGRWRKFDAGCEVQGLHKNGRIIPIEMAINEYKVRGEQCFAVTLRDISERNRFIAELTQAREEAERANQAKSAFLATMSHEIRTPMNGIIGMLEMLAHSNLPMNQADMVTTIRNSAFSLQSIINDILDFSKIESGRLELERALVNLNDLTEGCCETLASVASDKGVDINLFIAPQLPNRVWSDPTRLQQVLYNIVGNAIKFSGGRAQQRGRVSVRMEAVAEQPLRLSLTVADNGIGMSAETVNNLFTPFSQADVSTTRRFGGTGLGLVISKRLVDLFGGEISVNSTEGAGSCFTISLPLEPAEEQRERHLPDIAGINCILVASQFLNIADLGTYLEYAGANVRFADDMDAAVMHAKRLTSPLVIMDAGRGFLLDGTHNPFAALLSARYLLIERGRRQRPRLVAPNVVVMDGNVIRRYVFIAAVAVAANRVSSDIFLERDEANMESRDAAPPVVASFAAKDRVILVAEDDDISRKVILWQLGRLGYAAEVAPNGVQALELWRTGRYALLLTDLRMPEMDGYRLTELIRQEETGSTRTPILALTASATRDESNRAHSLGIDEYLTKPVQARVLSAALEKWLPGARGVATSDLPDEAGGARELPILDITVLRRLVGDDDAVVRKFLYDYLVSAHKLATELASAHAEADAQSVAAAAHKLKSSSRSVGALALADLCARLESAGKTGNKDAMAQDMMRFKGALAEVEANVEASLSNGHTG